jgi:hypothetical protein
MIPQIDTKVLRAELEDIEWRRNLVFRKDKPPITTLSGHPTENEEPNPGAEPHARIAELDTLFARSHRVRPFGIAFSGGGIRSATFNLGVLQGLANLRILPYVDYLSTVSGGGYIGSWLHGLIRNHCRGDVREAQEVLSAARNTVSAGPEYDPITFLRKYSNYLAPRPGLFSVDSWVIGSIWLRNVLLNQLILLPILGALILLVLFAGFLSQRPISPALADFQSVLTVITLVIATLIAAANLRNIVKQTAPQAQNWFTRLAVELSELAAVFTFVAAVMIAVKGQPERAVIQQEANTFAALFGDVPTFSVQNQTARLMSLFAIPVLYAALQIIGGFPECYRRMRKRADGTVSATTTLLSYLHVLWMMPIASAVTAWLISLVVTTLPIATSTTGSGGWIRIGFGPPLVALCILSGGSLLIGLMGPDYPDGAREWLARIGAIISRLAVAWLGLFVIAVYGPYVVSWTLANYAVLGVSAIGGWALTTGLGVLAGSSSRTDGAEGDQARKQEQQEQRGGMGASAVNVIVAIAPTVFMIGYLLIIATLVHVAIRSVNPAPYPTSTWVPEASRSVRYTIGVGGQGQQPALSTNVDVAVTPTDSWLGPRLGSIVTFQDNYWDVLAAARWALYAPEAAVNQSWGGTIVRVLRRSGTRTSLAMGALLLVVAAIASWRFNINEFSLHHFYKNRLVRCYLGASHTAERNADRLTGFDPKDDFPISTLVPDPSVGPAYLGPYAIVNTALNMNTGSELAQQERKATSFVFTPRFCGFQPLGSKEEHKAIAENTLDASGYRDTAAVQAAQAGQKGNEQVGFMYPDGPHLGTTMAISGAAANPNDGYHTSGPMAFLLTVFDARLGWWVGNPRNLRTSPTPGPRSAWLYLFAELLGQTTSRSRYVNLSDGGHFENLGLYELVRRRCRYIIVGDSEQDEHMTFESLGGAIRKCRADFGVEIDIDPTPIRLGENGLSRAHCVVGTIRYPEMDQGKSPGLTEGEFDVDVTDGERANARGWILYLKSSVTGDEPTDVTQYRAANATFPQQSTGDQFFSESQFESYRRLGLHVVSDAFDRIAPLNQVGDTNELREMFQQLARKWYGPIAASDEAAARLAEQYTQLMQRISARQPPGTFERQMLPALNAPPVASSAIPLVNEQIVLGIEAIQLMEDVFAAFALELQANRMNPHCAGWMGLFRRWVRREGRDTVLYAQIWPRVRTDYNPMFQKFVDVDLLHDASTDWPERP